MIHVLATISLKPGTRMQYLEVMQWLAPQVRAEVGCIEYAAAVDTATSIAAQVPANADQVTVIERWTNLPSLEVHLKAAHMDEYRSRVKDYVTGVQLQVLEPA